MWKEDKEQLIEMAAPVAIRGPVHPTLLTELGVLVGGMTKRELFAAMAMQGLLSNTLDGDVIKQSVRLADALLIELDKSCEHSETEATHIGSFCKKCGKQVTQKFKREECDHSQWTDMEHGLGQCRKCMAMLPYSAFGCSPHEA